MSFFQKIKSRLHDMMLPQVELPIHMLDSGPISDEIGFARYLISTPELALALTSNGLDPSTMQAALLRDTGDEDRGSIASVQSLIDSLVYLHAANGSPLAESPLHLFLTQIKSGVPLVRTVIETSGADLRAFAFQLAHGQPESAFEIVSAHGSEVELVNDDFTPMEFVVGILSEHFHMDRAAAIERMLKIHGTGNASMPCDSRDAAIRIATQVNAEARRLYYPLLCKVVASRETPT